MFCCSCVSCSPFPKFFALLPRDSKAVFRNVSAKQTTKRAAKSTALSGSLLSEVQLRDNGSVTLDVLCFEIVEKRAALTYHLQQSAAGVVVLLMHTEVLVEVVDAVR